MNKTVETVGSMNKAFIGGLVSGALVYANTHFGLGVDAEFMALIVAGVTGFLVWAVPNIQRKIEA